jgi:hypothetical protein
MRSHPDRTSLGALLALMALVLVTTRVASANTVSIDFESIPGGTPHEGLVVQTQFLGEGVYIFTEGGEMELAKVGGNLLGFDGPFGCNTPAPGVDVGKFFLTHVGGVPDDSPTFSFTVPQQRVSGELLNVVQGDSFQVSIVNTAGTQQINQIITAANGGPGKASFFQFDQPFADIQSLSITYTGTNPAPQYGIDNISYSSGPLSIPLPPAFWPALLTLVAGFIVVIERRSRKA